MKYFYECTNQHCREYHKRVCSHAGPATHRAATGRFLSCAVCDKTLRLTRLEWSSAKKPTRQKDG